MKTSLVLLASSLLCAPALAQIITRCFDCPQYCSTCTWNENFQVLEITSAQKGYSIDNLNKICYKSCPSDTYYQAQDQVCYLCGDGCLTCEKVGDNFRITSAKRGYEIDEINERCYQSCNSKQYYDPSTLSCQFCPTGCTSCSKVDGTVIVTGAQRKWNVDQLNNLCYETCGSDQFYDRYRATCETCPNGCSACFFDEDDAVIIESAYRGYSIDTYTNTCYLTCTSSQYYDASLGYCINCPEGCSTCQSKNGFLQILAPRSGYKIDSFNSICYKTCSGGEYYNYNNQFCDPCPDNCVTCSLGNDGVLTILTASRGYTIDQFSQQCYPTCNQGEYYSPF